MKIEIKQLAIAGVIIAMVLGFVLLQYLPMSNTIKKLSQQKIDHKRLSEQATMDQQKIPVLQYNIAKLEQKVGNIEKKIPNESNYGTFLQSITEIMKKNRLSEQIVKPDQETAVGNLRCIPITMEAKGSSQQLFQFFRDVENSERQFKLEQLQFQNEKYGGKVRMIAKGNIFYRR